MKMVALWSKSTKSTFPNIILSRQNRFWTFILCPFSKFSTISFSCFIRYIYNYLNIKRYDCDIRIKISIYGKHGRKRKTNINIYGYFSVDSDNISVNLHWLSNI